MTPAGEREPGSFFRLSPSRLAAGWFALCVVVLALFAIPLWYTWRANYATQKTYVDASDLKALLDTFDREGAPGLAKAIDARLLRSPSEDEVVFLADASRSRVAGNLETWPSGIPEQAGVAGVIVDLGGRPLRIVASTVHLPGGYHLLIGRESARFQSLTNLFWYGIGGASAIALALGALIAWLLRRALLSQVQEISRAASAIAEGDLSRRVTARPGSDVLDTLARTVNGMLEQLARQNAQLADEIGVRRHAEQALHRAHDDLESVVAQRTAQLAQANESLRRGEAILAEAQKLSLTGSFGWEVASGRVFWSDETFNLLGMDPSARPTFDDVVRRVHPEDLGFFQSTIDRATRERAGIDFEHRLLLDGGKVKYVHVRARPGKNGSGALEYVGAVTDVTALRRSQRALAGENRLLEMVATGRPLPEFLDAWCRFVEESAPGSRCTVLLLDPAGKRVQSGAAPSLPSSFTEAIDGKEARADAGPCGMAIAHREQVIVADIASDPRWDVDQWRSLALAHGLRACWSTPILSQGGKALGAFAVYLPEPGAPTAEHQALIEQGIHIARIAIERTKAEDALSQLRAELAHLARVATLGELTASIAHEINQPLAGIMNNASASLRMLAAAPPNLEQVAETARRTLRDGNRAAEVIARLRDLFRKKKGGRESVQMNDAIREVIALTRHEVQKVNVTVWTDLADDLPPLVGDRVQLQQVVLNLILNAAEAMGGVEDPPRRLVIATSVDEGRQLRVSVKDSGVGLDPEVGERIFDAFYTSKKNGMGMGLSIARSIVENHGGRLWATPNDGPGATFSFTLRLPPLEMEASAQA